MTRITAARGSRRPIANEKLYDRENNMKITRRALLLAGAAGGAALAAPSIVRAEAPIELKVTHWLPPVHQIHKELLRWSADIAQRSANKVTIQVLPAGQMGPPPRQFDLARTGVADIAYFLPGLNPGRFPMTDLFQLPFLFNKPGQVDKPLNAADASAIATSVASELNTQREFEGTKILYIVASPTGSLFMSKATVRKPANLKGLRIRHNGPVGAAQLAAWGATPVAVAPAEVADAMDKGTIDGMIFNYEGGRAFQIGGAVKNVTELNWAATAFTLVMNKPKYDSLPADVRKLIDETTGGDAGRRVGALYDSAEAAGREYLIKSGAQIIKPTLDEFNVFSAALKPTQESMLGALEAKGLKAREFYAHVRRLVGGAKA
jgi:TRAP-type C4-dicarboxylate transport system substrate-binding protein